jgi:subtilisin
MGIMKKIRIIIVSGFAILALLVLAYSGFAQDEPVNGKQVEISELLVKAQEGGSVPVIIGFVQPGFDPANIGVDTPAGRSQSRDITRTQDQILERLTGFSVSQVTRFEYIPFMALRVDQAALQTLQDDPAITSIVEDLDMAPHLARSLRITRAEGAHSLNYRGAGTAIAVLDTGFDKNHPDLSGKVVAEACYSSTDLLSGRFSACPNGQNSQVGNGSAAPVSRLITGFEHGTHVAAISAGVAPAAKIVAIQVFGRIYETAAKECTSGGLRSPCMLSRTSDYAKGLERVMTLRTTHNIVAVNMSLGGGSYVSTCDNDPQFTTVKLLVQSLRNNNVLTVASAGNSSYRNSMGGPACLSSTVSVGATMTYPDTDIDKVADFSNVGFSTTLLAPGLPIEAAVPTTATDCGQGTAPASSRCFKGGTSMAAPHVAGAVAVLRSARPNATAQQIVTALTTTGPLVTDQRPGGTITRRRLDVYGALCTLVACDPDDFRILALNTTLTGTIASGDPQDIYYFNGTGDQRIVVTMNRISGTLDPFLSIWDEEGNLLAFNDNGGGGVNARVNLLILPRTGRYRIVAGKAQGALTGGYQISVTQGSLSQNPVPFIRSLQNTSATAGSAGFWLPINGANFLSSSITRLNGVNSPTFYSNSERIWIYLYPSNLSSVTTHSIDVVNPGPGGGTSLPFSFVVTAAFNGESRLLAPQELTTSVGEKTEFAVEWVHPTDSWRNMQNMELKLADDAFGSSLWLRLTEDNPESTLYLLNSAGEPLYSGTLVSGQFGVDEDWVVEDVVTLHFGETKFFGSGQTIVLTPTVSFGPAAVGTYDIRFSVDDDEEESEVQNADVLGRFSVLEAGCQVAPTEVSISGPSTGQVNTPYQYTATVSPPNTTGPISYTWFPEPASGQGTAGATYQWSSAGQQPVGVIAENCADLVSDIETIPVYTTTSPDLSLTKTAPAVALSGEAIEYNLTIANNGATAATNINITDVLPVGAMYVSGGNLNGNTVTWTIPTMEGYGASEQVTLVVTANATIINNSYAAVADGGHAASGNPAVTTRIVDVKVEANPLSVGELVYEGAGVRTEVELPAGSFFATTTVAYKELPLPANSLPSGLPFAGRAFRLDGYQGNELVPDLEPGEPLPVVVTYRDADVTGMDVDQLRLYRWTGNHWSSSGIECQTEPALRRVTCRVFAPLGEFALAEGSQSALFLPAVIR